MKYVRCPACAGTGYLDTELGADEPAAVACTHCCSYGWFDLETGKPADVEPPLFTLTSEAVMLTTPTATDLQPISRQDRDRSIAYATRQISRYERDLAATDCSTECGIAHVAVVESVLAGLEQQLDAIRHRPLQD